MDVSRVRLADWLVAFAGLVLLVSLFLPWYDSNSDSSTGFQSLALIDKLLLITGLLALLLPVLVALKARPAVQKPTAIVVILALLSVICIVVRLVNIPEFDAVNTPVGILGGAWLALAAAVVMLLAGLKSIGERRTSPARVPAQA
jgi:hypothetical protein